MAELVVNAQATKGRERDGDIYRSYKYSPGLSSDWPIKALRDFLLQFLRVKFIDVDSAAMPYRSQSIIRFN